MSLETSTLRLLASLASLIRWLGGGRGVNFAKQLCSQLSGNHPKRLSIILAVQTSEKLTPCWHSRLCPTQQQLRFDIDPLSNLLVLIQVFNRLHETGKGPIFEREDLHQDLLVMNIRKRHRHHAFVKLPKCPG